MILGKDKKKLPKSRFGVFEYNDLGYLRRRCVQFLALLGWSPRNGQEIFNRDEAVGTVDLSNAATKKRLSWISIS